VGPDDGPTRGRGEGSTASPLGAWSTGAATTAAAESCQPFAVAIGRCTASSSVAIPGAFAGRVEAARRERPPRWKRVTCPLLFGPRLLVPARLEPALMKTGAWQALRTLRR
jgi:hypothetical protein